MKHTAFILLPLLALAACADQTTAPDIEVEHSAFQKKPPKPTPEPEPPANPVFAFEAGGPGARGLWVADEGGSNKTELLTRGSFFIPSWSAAGEGTTESPYQILITGVSTGVLPVERVDVVLDNGEPTVGDTTTLSTSMSYVQARISPDGYHFVAVHVGPPPEQQFSLVLANLETFDPVTIHSRVGHEAFQPVWNSTGTHIGFFDWDHGTGVATWNVLELATSSVSTDPDPICASGPPKGVSWSPVSDEIAFDCGGTLYAVALDGNLMPAGSPTDLGAGITPVWSADGGKLAYTNRDRIYIKTIGSGARDERLTGGRRPDWRR
jgi:hypothetical protein